MTAFRPQAEPCLPSWKKKAGPVLENPQTSRSVPHAPFYTWLLGCSLVFPCQGLQGTTSLWHPREGPCVSPGSLVRVSPPSDRAVGLQAWTPGPGYSLLHQTGLQGHEVSPSWPQGRTTPPFRPQDTDVSHPQTPGRHNDPLRQGPSLTRALLKAAPLSWRLARRPCHT